jgi:hypothetical protein
MTNTESSTPNRAQQHVLNAVTRYPGKTALQIRANLNLPRTTRALEGVQACLADLVSMGLIGREVRATGASIYTVAA